MGTYADFVFTPKDTLDQFRQYLTRGDQPLYIQYLNITVPKEGSRLGMAEFAPVKGYVVVWPQYFAFISKGETYGVMDTFAYAMFGEIIYLFKGRGKSNQATVEQWVQTSLSTSMCLPVGKVSAKTWRGIIELNIDHPQRGPTTYRLINPRAALIVWLFSKWRKKLIDALEQAKQTSL